MVPWIYLSTLLAALKCFSIGKFINLAGTSVMNMISGLVAHKNNKPLIKLLYIVASIEHESSSFLNLSMYNRCAQSFAIYKAKLLQQFTNILALRNKDSLLALHHLHTKKESHFSQIIHFKYLFHLVSELLNLISIASTHKNIIHINEVNKNLLFFLLDI